MGVKFLKYYKWLCVATFELIVLGGAVRALNAGLACPDWPLCFGDFVPDFHPQVYLEFIHRVLAGGIALGTVTMNGALLLGWVSPAPRRVRWLAALSFLLLASQIALGALTVLLQLKANVVTMHLALGTAFYSTLLLIYASLPRPVPATVTPRDGVKVMALVVLLAIYGQILLGGTVATNYAALVCTDFPLCHGQFIPTLQGAIGLQVIHRLAAYTVTLTILGFFILIWRQGERGPVFRQARDLLLLVIAQVALGISNVVFLNPPIITVLHLAGATALLTVSLQMVYGLFFKMVPIPGAPTVD